MKKILSIAISAISILAMTSTSVHATYQAIGSGNDVSQESRMINVRKMEEEGQALGLKDTIDTTTLESTTTNNIDIHMMKNTEWGAMVILSQSTKYGKQPISTDEDYVQTTRWIRYSKGGTPIEDRRLATTTGNTSGIYMYNQWKRVAAVISNGEEDTFYNRVASRYIDKYTPRNVNFGSYWDKNYVSRDAKAGDALWETMNWHVSYYQGNSDATSSEGYYLVRGITQNDWTDYSFKFSDDGGNKNTAYRAYAVVVNGEGLK